MLFTFTKFPTSKGIFTFCADCVSLGFSKSTYVGDKVETLYPFTYAVPGPNSTAYKFSAAVLASAVVAPISYTPLLNVSSRFSLILISKSLIT